MLRHGNNIVNLYREPTKQPEKIVQIEMLWLSLGLILVLVKTSNKKKSNVNTVRNQFQLPKVIHTVSTLGTHLHDRI